MTEERIIFEQDGNIVGITEEGKYFESYKTTANVAILRGAGLYIKRLEQENEELSKLIRDTEDYAEVCSVCKDEVTIYPNISGRTDYTQNEVECRTLAQIITRKNNLEQENKKLKKDVQLFKCLDTFGEGECHCACRCLGNEFCEDADKKINSFRSALEKIRDLCIHYENTNDKCITNCYAHFIVTDLIQDKINEVLK